MFRRLAVFAVAAVALVANAVPAQAATYEGSLTSVGGDWVGLGSTIELVPHASVSETAFVAACLADSFGAPDLVGQFLTSPLNGLDAQIFDLGEEKMGAFAVKGPGADILATAPDPSGIFGAIPIPEYDLDLDFFADVSTGCADANYNEEFTAECHSAGPDSDEATPCIVGYEGSDFKLHGARYVAVVASLNLVGEIPFTLTTP